MECDGICTADLNEVLRILPFLSANDLIASALEKYPDWSHLIPVVGSNVVDEMVAADKDGGYRTSKVIQEWVSTYFGVAVRRTPTKRMRSG